MKKLAVIFAGLLLVSPASADMYQDASNAKTETVFRFGSGLTPQYETAVSTTATTTKDSAVITVANPAGIRVGDSISTQSPTFVTAGGIEDPGAMAVVVKAIAGNNITLSKSADLTATGVSVTFGVDRFVPGNTLFTDVFAARHGWFGAASKGKSTWVNQYWAGVDYPVLSAVFGASEYGLQGGMFANRSSDGSDSSQWVIALGSLLVDDQMAPRPLKSSWNNYWQSNLIGNVPGLHIQTESSVFSRWEPTRINPYVPNVIGGTENLRLDCGYEAGTSRNCSTALHITPNQAKYLAGIIIDFEAVEPANGPLSPAIEMARNYAIDWYAPMPAALGAAAEAKGGVPANRRQPSQQADVPSHRAWRLYSTATSTTETGYFDLGENGSVSISGATPYTQYNAPGSHLGQVGMTDGLNMTIDSPSVGATVLKGNGQINIIMSNGLTYMAAPVMDFRTQPYTVATLPVCNDAATYKIASVSDQSGSPTYRGGLTGGGSLKVPVFCNGTAWEAH